jgi:hypothetical protein
MRVFERIDVRRGMERGRVNNALVWQVSRVPGVCRAVGSDVYVLIYAG